MFDQFKQNMDFMNIQDLKNFFEKNAILCRDENLKLRKEFVKNNPDSPIPKWFDTDFCINTALASMCSAILELQKRLDEK